ncbi:mandelate racemase/muconate lactonizing enzyme family protein [Schlesneria paludicola]|uniref:mandelate racemase/muconate lactonizing enzyme family protein n=1 Tax=Schlesneria paludicola TaxID=360056 RepID=UPI00029AAF23|nr:enolase C-terminal domain-like protein [Schlesneria paludicola]
MKIERIEAIPVRIPLKAGLTTRTAHGVHATSDYAIIRVYTDEGVVGLGEATVAPRWTGETSSTCLSLIKELLAPALIGQNPLNITQLRQRMDRVVKLNPFTKAALEMAFWDIAGKVANQPICRMLGGPVRDTMRIKLVIGAFEKQEVTALAERFLAMGVTCIKVKTGIDPDEDIARVRRVREVAGPDIPITIDSNCGWNITTARQTLLRLAELNILLAEQPIPPNDPAAMASLRATSPMPIMADESVFSLTDAWTVCAAGAADILSVYPGKHGGISGTVEIANVAKAAGLACAIGSNLELGIGTAAMLHVAAALPTIDSERYPADLVGPIYHEADLLTEPLQLGPPAAKCPMGPGLGVSLDEQQLKKWRID